MDSWIIGCLRIVENLIKKFLIFLIKRRLWGLPFFFSYFVFVSLLFHRYRWVSVFRFSFLFVCLVEYIWEHVCSYSSVYSDAFTRIIMYDYAFEWCLTRILKFDYDNPHYKWEEKEKNRKKNEKKIKTSTRCA